MKKVFSMKDTKVDGKGKKTTITIQTEDPKVIRSLLDNTSEAVGSKAKAKPGNTSKAKASTKKASSDKKKDSIKAEVREVKPKAKKEANKKTAKPKSLPAPKAKSKCQKSKICNDGVTLTVYGSDGKCQKVERLDNFYNKKTNSLWTVEEFDKDYIYLVIYVKNDRWKVSHKYFADNFKKIAD